MKEAALVVLAALVTFALHVSFAGRHALEAAQEAQHAGHLREAIAHYEAAGRAYVPFASASREAACRALAAIRQDKTALPAMRLAAARAERSMIVATRSIANPTCADWDHADEASLSHEIAALEAADPEGAPAAGDTPAARLAWYADRLAVDPRPGSGSIALTALGLVAFLAAAAALVRRPGWRAGIIAVAGLAVWALGLYNA